MYSSSQTAKAAAPHVRPSQVADARPHKQSVTNTPATGKAGKAGGRRRQIDGATHTDSQVAPVPPTPSPNASVYVGGLPRNMTNLHGYQIFAPFGALININLQPDPRADTSYAYVQFRSEADAACAVQQLNGSVLQRRRLYAAIHTPP